MRTFLYFKLSVSVVFVGLLSGCEGEAPPPQAAGAPTVSVLSVRAEPVALSRELPGRAAPFKVAEVRPQVSGIVEERLFTEGGQVEAGEVLYQIDDATYRADYNSAIARLDRAQASLDLAKVNADRIRGLVESNTVSRQENDNATAALRQAEADLAVARAAVASSEVLLGYTRIVAPIGGRIGKSTVTQGALVTANQPQPLATIQQLDPIYIDVTQSSSELLQLRKALADGNLQDAELPVVVYLEDGTPYRHEGKVAFSEVSVDPTTGRFSVRVVVPNPDHLLLPGMYLRAKLGMGIREEGILVPQKAVSRGPSGETTVMLVTGDNQVESRTVRVTRTVGHQWLVDSGLEPGDRVVTEGLQKIQPGMEVVVEREYAAESVAEVEGE